MSRAPTLVSTAYKHVFLFCITARLRNVPCFCLNDIPDIPRHEPRRRRRSSGAAQGGSKENRPRLLRPRRLRRLVRVLRWQSNVMYRETTGRGPASERHAIEVNIYGFPHSSSLHVRRVFSDTNQLAAHRVQSNLSGNRFELTLHRVETV